MSTEPHPNGAIGLQLLYPDRALGWRDASELGASWIRAEVRWDWIQTGPNSAFDEKYAVWFTEFGTASNVERGALLDTLAIESTLVPMTIFFNDIDIDWISDTYGLRTKNGMTKPDYAQFKRLFSGEIRE